MGPKSHKLGGGPRGNLQFDANTLYAVRREDALELISAGLARPHEPGDVELDEAFALANPPPPPPELEPEPASAEPLQIDIEDVLAQSEAQGA